MKQPIERTYPYIRRVEERDYARVWEIWMQDHIIQWMSFTKNDLESFRETFNRLNRQSDVYVMVDNIDNKETIVGVRRIKYLSGPYQHTAEFCSMGVDKQYLNKGYGKLFWSEFENIVKKNPQIKCIRFTQSGGNDTAFHISDSRGYTREALFPDWLERVGQKEQSHYYLIERYSYQIIDPELLEKSKGLKSKQYEPKLPSLVPNHAYQNLTIKKIDDTIQVMQDDQLILQFDYFPDHSVIQHIAFLDNLIVYTQDNNLCQSAFRQAIDYLLNQKDVKKLELFTHTDQAISLCQSLGFWIRGEKIASICQNGEYSNELGVEYSFFDIEDAKSLLSAFKDNQSILFQLDQLQNIIHSLEENKICDALGKNYLANIVYQIVRDELLDRKLFVSLDEKPWAQVLQQCPPSFSEAAQQLQNALIQSKNQKIESPKLSEMGLFKPGITPVTQQESNPSIPPPQDSGF